MNQRWQVFRQRIQGKMEMFFLHHPLLYRRRFVLLAGIFILLCLVGFGATAGYNQQVVQKKAEEIKKQEIEKNKPGKKYNFSRMKRGKIYFFRTGDILKVKIEKAGTTRTLSFSPQLASTYNLVQNPQRHKWEYTFPKDVRKGFYFLSVTTTDDKTGKVAKIKTVKIKIVDTYPKKTTMLESKKSWFSSLLTTFHVTAQAQGSEYENEPPEEAQPPEESSNPPEDTPEEEPDQKQDNSCSIDSSAGDFDCGDGKVCNTQPAPDRGENCYNDYYKDPEKDCKLKPKKNDDGKTWHCDNSSDDSDNDAPPSEDDPGPQPGSLPSCTEQGLVDDGSGNCVVIPDCSKEQYEDWAKNYCSVPVCGGGGSLRNGGTGYCRSVGNNRSDGRLDDQQVQDALSCKPDDQKNLKLLIECSRTDDRKFHVCWDDYTQTGSGKACVYGSTQESLYTCQDFDSIDDVSDNTCQKILQLRQKLNDWDSMLPIVANQLQIVCGSNTSFQAVPTACEDGQLSYDQYIQSPATGCLWRAGNPSDLNASQQTRQSVKPEYCGVKNTVGHGRLPNSYDFSRMEDDIGDDWLVWLSGMFKNGIFPGIDWDTKEIVYYSKDAFEQTYCKDDPSKCPTNYASFSLADWQKEVSNDNDLFGQAQLMSQDFCFDKNTFNSYFPEMIEKYHIKQQDSDTMGTMNPQCHGQFKNPTEEQVNGILLTTALDQKYAGGAYRVITDDPLFEFLFNSKEITDWISGYEFTDGNTRINAILGILSFIPEFKAESLAKLLKLKPAEQAAQAGWELKNAVSLSGKDGIAQNLVNKLGKVKKEIKNFTSVFGHLTLGSSPNLAYRRIEDFIKAKDFGSRTQPIQSGTTNEIQSESWALTQLNHMLDSVKQVFEQYPEQARAKGLVNIPEAINAFKAHALFIGRPEFEQITQQMANRIYDLTNAGYTVIVYLKDNPIGASDGFINTEVLRKYSFLQQGKPELQGKVVVSTNAMKTAKYAASIGADNVKILVFDDVVVSGQQMGDAIVGVNPRDNLNAQWYETNGGLVGWLIGSGGFDSKTAKEAIEIDVMAIAADHPLKNDAYGLHINSYYDLDKYTLPITDNGFRGTSVASFYSSTDYGWESTLETINRAYNELNDLSGSQYQEVPLLAYVRRPYKIGGILYDHVVNQWNALHNYFPVLE